MNKNLVLDESLASASGVLLISNGEIVEFFPRRSNGKDLGLSGDDFFLTDSDEAELAEALREFSAKIKILNARMDASQSEIEKLNEKSAARNERYEAAMQKLEGLLKK